MKAHTVYGIVVEAPMSDAALVSVIRLDRHIRRTTGHPMARLVLTNDEHDKCMHEISAAYLRISEPEGQLTEIAGIPVELENT